MIIWPRISCRKTSAPDEFRTTRVFSRDPPKALGELLTPSGVKRISVTAPKERAGVRRATPMAELMNVRRMIFGMIYYENG
ncbi:MAG: hypothetical protein ACJAQT_000672 [Akkermansiaceae bacterium]|jgi:hypothetical protein